MIFGAMLSFTACRYGMVAQEKSLGLLEFPDGASSDFGEVVKGASAELNLSLKNRRSGSAKQVEASFATGSLFTFKGGTYPGTGGTCGTTIAPNETCSLVVTFSPTDLGIFSDSLTLQYFDGEETISLSHAFSGTTTASGNLAFSVGSYDFGNTAVGGSGQKTITISNNGEAQATSISANALSAPFSFLGGTYPGTGGDCAATLDGGDTCTIVLAFSPAVQGAASTTLVITYTNGANPDSVSLPLSGTGGTGDLTISDGPTYAFGSQYVGISVDKIFTLTNTGTAPLASLGAGSPAMGAPFEFKGGAFPGTGGTCSTSLAASATCTVVVTYSPISSGAHSATLAISFSNGASTQTRSITMTGNASTVALLTLSDGPTYDFGSKYIGQMFEKTFTVVNSGETTATAMAEGTPALSAPFDFKGGTYPGTGGTCGVSLAAGLSCTIVITFAPATSAVVTDTIRLTYHNGNATQTASRDVTGTASATALIVFAATPLYDFGTQALSSTTSASLTVSNGGGVTATSLSASALSAPFTFKNLVYPGTGGTCGTSLASGASCTIVVEYAPSVEVTSSATVTLSYHDGSSNQSASLSLSGTGGLGHLTISDGATYSFGTPAVNSVNEKAFTISSDGEIGVSAMVEGTPALSAPYSFKGGSYPGTGGTCGTSLAALASCSVVITYSPTVIGVSNATIRVNYQDGQALQTATRALSATALTEAALTISNGAQYDYGSVYVTQASDHTFTLTNSGASTATGLADGGSSIAAPYSYKDGSFPGSGGTCGATLNGGASCTFVVTFTPTAKGTFNDTISLQYDTGAQVTTASRNITATGLILPTITISESPSYDFGSVYKSSSATKTFTLSNSGDTLASSLGQGVALAAPFSYVGGTYPGTGGTCGVSLASGASCTIVVRFLPAATGVFSDTISISYHNTIATQTATRAISGTGVLAVLSFSGSPTFQFGSQAVSGTTTASITVTNTGGGNATAFSSAAPALASPFSFSGGGFPGTGGTCAATLSAGSSCTLVFDFSPIVTGAANDTVFFTYHDGEATQNASFDMQGTGVNALLTISDGATYAFGTVYVSSSAEKIFTVTSTGSGSASSIVEGVPALSAPFSFKGGAYPGTGGTCSSSLNAGTNCTIVVSFSPTSSADFSATIKLSYSDGVTTTSATRPVTGSGAGVASLIISDGVTYSFGTTYANSSVDKTFSLTNSGGATATSMSGSSFATGYAYKGGSYPGTGGTCATTLLPAASCTVVVTFTPPSAGTFLGNLIVSYQDGQQSTTAIRPLTGVGVVPAVLTISDGPTYSYGNVGVGDSKDKTFTVSNSGPISGTALTVGLPALGSEFQFKGGSFPGTGGSCSATLAASASCTIVVTFQPTSSATHNDTVTLSYFDGVATVSASRNVTGIGPVGGTLDTSFDSDGYLNTAVGSQNDFGRAIAVQSDGKIIVVGYSVNGSSIDQIALTRYLSDGTLDTSFDTDGKVTTAIGSLGSLAYSVAIQTDGKILVAGYTNQGGGDLDFVVVRYLSNGSLDTTFSTDGIQTTSFGSGDDKAHGIAIQNDGKIIVAGYSYQGGTADYDIAALRYDSSGNLDTTFGGGDGLVLIDLGNEDRSYAVALQSDGKVVLGGTSFVSGTDSLFCLARLTSVGDLDTTFNTTGYLTTDLGGSDDRAFSVAIQSDGKVVAGGYTHVSGNDYDFAVVRVGSDGTLDSGFGGGDGVSVLTPGSGDDRAQTVLVQSNGKIVVAGYQDGEGSDSQLFLSRLNSDGSTDATFGTSGSTATNPSGGMDKIYAIALDSALSLVAAGEMSNGTNSDFALAKYWP